MIAHVLNATHLFPSFLALFKFERFGVVFRGLRCPGLRPPFFLLVGVPLPDASSAAPSAVDIVVVVLVGVSARAFEEASAVPGVGGAGGTSASVGGVRGGLGGGGEGGGGEGGFGEGSCGEGS